MTGRTMDVQNRRSMWWLKKAATKGRRHLAIADLWSWEPLDYNASGNGTFVCRRGDLNIVSAGMISSGQEKCLAYCDAGWHGFQ